MKTTALEIQCASRAGLVLCGDDNGAPEWCGSGSQFNKFEEYMEWVMENGSYPWSPRKIEVKHV